MVKGWGARPSYEVEIYGANTEIELPFVIGILGSFSGSKKRENEVSERRFLEVSRQNFDDLVEAVAPELSIKTENEALAADPELRELLRTWRGLRRLLDDIEEDAPVKVRIFDISKAELASAFRSSRSADSSIIFRKVYEEEFGQLGGQPYSLLVADFSFTYVPSDVSILRSLAELGALAMCSVVGRASPKLFGVENWEELRRVEEIDQVFTSRSYLDWRALRDQEDARHLVLTVPGNPSTHRGHDFGCLYSFVATLAQIYGNSRDWSAGDRSARSDVSESTFSSQQQEAIGRCGFAIAGDLMDPDNDLLAKTQTVQCARRYHDDQKTLASEQRKLLPVVLSTLEFGRAIKCIVRDGIGSFLDTKQIEDMLNPWLSRYVARNAIEHGAETLPTGPLDEARVEVLDPPGLGRSSGYYTVNLHLRPRLPGVSIDECVLFSFRVPAPRF